MHHEVIIKRCGCGRFYGRRRWLALPLVGYMSDGGDRHELFELRLCTCGSSLAVSGGAIEP